MAGADGSTEYLNGRGRAYAGLPPEAVGGWSWVTLVHPEDADRAREGWMDATRTGTPFEIEYRIRRHDGEFRWHAFRALPLRDPDGRVARWIGTATDIDDHRRAEDEVRAAKEYSEQLVETSNALVLVLDPDANVLVLNKAGEEITGYTRDELVGRSWEIVVPRDRYPEAWTGHLDQVGEGVQDRYENPLLTKSGEERFILWQNGQLIQRGDVTGTVSFGIDVTDRVEATRELERSFELLRKGDDERRRLLGRLVRVQEEERKRIAGDIHDDSIQVLTALALRLDMLAAMVNDPPVLARLTETQQTARRAIDRLRQLMFELRPPILDRAGLAQALEVLLDQIRHEAGLRITLANALTREPPAETAATAYRIAQEALLNVRKHARAQQVAVQLEESEGGVAVRIADDGRGFEQKPPEPGHLGLVSMRERAELAGGWFRLVSEPKQGTTVEFMLPVAAETAP